MGVDCNFTHLYFLELRTGPVHLLTFPTIDDRVFPLEPVVDLGDLGGHPSRYLRFDLLLLHSQQRHFLHGGVVRRRRRPSHMSRGWEGVHMAAVRDNCQGIDFLGLVLADPRQIGPGAGVFAAADGRTGEHHGIEFAAHGGEILARAFAKGG